MKTAQSRSEDVGWHGRTCCFCHFWLCL